MNFMFIISILERWCFAQAKFSQCHSGIRNSFTVFLIKSFTTNKMYLQGACSGFEPELPVHIRTWTWNAVNITTPFSPLIYL